MVEVRFDMHPVLVAALERLSEQRGCSLEHLLLRLINEGLGVEMKISQISVLKREQNDD